MAGSAFDWALVLTSVDVIACPDVPLECVDIVTAAVLLEPVPPEEFGADALLCVAGEIGAVVLDEPIGTVISLDPALFGAQLNAQNVTNPTPLAVRNHMAVKCAELRHRSPNQYP